MQFKIGTAGWSYLKWDKEFYPKGTKAAEKLKYYASQFNSVELNNTFYNLPAKEQFAEWEKQVPAEFEFAVKASRYITHTKRLKEADKILPPLLEAISLQKKKGPVLFQLPPAFPQNLERLEAFLKQLPAKRSYAIELRDVSWHDEAVYRLLNRHKIAFCLYDTPEGISPRKLTADFAYARLRGRKTGNLNAFLKEWKAWLSNNTDKAYVFFDNREDKSLAFGNALAFRELTE